jgi:exosortase/archaeosortase family protein
MAKKKKRVLRKRPVANRKEEKSGISGILLRYALALGSSLGNLWIFYFIFTPLTIYPVLWILQMFYPAAELVGNSVFIRGIVIEISKACVAGSAYFLLFMLNMITREIRVRKRILIFIFSSFLLLLLNIARIVVLSVMNVNDAELFEPLHMFFWYFVSVAYVFFVWIATIHVFKIKAIPFYSDFVYIKKLAKKGRR